MDVIDLEAQTDDPVTVVDGRGESAPVGGAGAVPRKPSLSPYAPWRAWGKRVSAPVAEPVATDPGCFDRWSKRRSEDGWA